MAAAPARCCPLGGSCHGRVPRAVSRLHRLCVPVCSRCPCELLPCSRAAPCARAACHIRVRVPDLRVTSVSVCHVPQAVSVSCGSVPRPCATVSPTLCACPVPLGAAWGLCQGTVTSCGHVSPGAGGGGAAGVPQCPWVGAGEGGASSPPRGFKTPCGWSSHGVPSTVTHCQALPVTSRLLHRECGDSPGTGTWASRGGEAGTLGGRWRCPLGTLGVSGSPWGKMSLWGRGSPEGGGHGGELSLGEEGDVPGEPGGPWGCDIPMGTGAPAGDGDTPGAAPSPRRWCGPRGARWRPRPCVRCCAWARWRPHTPPNPRAPGTTRPPRRWPSTSQPFATTSTW